MDDDDGIEVKIFENWVQLELEQTSKTRIQPIKNVTPDWLELNCDWKCCECGETLWIKSETRLI